MSPIEQSIRTLVMSLAGSISEADASEIELYLYHSEWGCAMYLIWVVTSRGGGGVDAALAARLRETTLMTDTDVSVLDRNFPLKIRGITG